jgi:hypothetical protein
MTRRRGPDLSRADELAKLAELHTRGILSDSWGLHSSIRLWPTVDRTGVGAENPI